MRLLLLNCCFFITCVAKLSAQQAETFNTIRMEPYPEKGIYRFAAFKDGTVFLRNGTQHTEKFNFNITLNEMHFISEKGDTLSMAEPESVKHIDLQGTKFYYDKGYYQVIDTAGGIVLAFTQLLSIQQHRASAYGLTEPHEGVRAYTYYSMNGKTDAIGKDEKITVTAKEVYFFGDRFGHFSKANKYFFMEQFPKQADALKNFIATNHINFHRYSSLLQLMQYCKSLQ